MRPSLLQCPAASILHLHACQQKGNAAGYELGLARCFVLPSVKLQPLAALYNLASASILFSLRRPDTDNHLDPALHKSKMA